MIEKTIKDCVILGGISLIGLYAFNNRPLIYEVLGLDVTRAQEPQVQSDEAASAAQNATAQSQMTQISSGTVSIRKSADGHFWAQSSVNGAYVKFLVDTGASTVALTADDARKAGLRMDDLNFNIQVNTAGGVTPAAQATLRTVSVGAITLRDVKALIIKDGLSTSLLGMSYLGKLQKVEATPQTLLLRL